MAGALKLAAAVAALAVVGWSRDRRDRNTPGSLAVDAPGPSPSSLVGADWAFVAGRVDYARSTDSWFTSEYEDSSIRVGMGYSAHGDVVVTDDPRMVGTGTRTLNFFSRPTRMATGISAPSCGRSRTIREPGRAP